MLDISGVVPTTDPRVLSIESALGAYPEITDDTELVVLDPDFQHQVEKVGSTFLPQVKERVISLLRK